MVHLHPVTDPAKARPYNIPRSGQVSSPAPPSTLPAMSRPSGSRQSSIPVLSTGPTPYASVMSHTPWGRRVFATAEARGCFADPNGCNFYAQDLVSLGVPVCR